MLDEAIAFAALAHAGQRRKYTGEPYVLHPIEVMGLVREHAEGWTEEMLVAALLHDVIEDTAVNAETIKRRFGEIVLDLVEQLTDEFTKENYPDANRAERKALEVVRISQCSAEAQTIKLADLISNTKSIAVHDPGFARVYLAEKDRMLAVLTKGDATLRSLARAALDAAVV